MYIEPALPAIVDDFKVVYKAFVLENLSDTSIEFIV